MLQLTVNKSVGLLCNYVDKLILKLNKTEIDQYTILTVQFKSLLFYELTWRYSQIFTIQAHFSRTIVKQATLKRIIVSVPKIVINQRDHKLAQFRHLGINGTGTSCNDCHLWQLLLMPKYCLVGFNPCPAKLIVVS